MKFLEKDLEEIIFESSKESLNEKGLPIKGKLLRQVKIGNYGRADIITVDRLFSEASEKYSNSFHQINITLYELKKDKISVSAFLQAVGYLRGIQRYIKERGIFESCIIDYKIILIGKQIDTHSTFCYLPDILVGLFEYKFLQYYTYEYDVDGIVFENRSGFYLSDESFNL